MGREKGLALIELVVVMVILGILSLFVIPKFYTFSSQARAADINGLVGALNSAKVNAHGAALLKGLSAASGQSITMDGTTVNLVFGYPAATATGIRNAITFSSIFTVTFAGNVATFQINTAPTPARCRVTYRAATNVRNPPVITATTTGC